MVKAMTVHVTADTSFMCVYMKYTVSLQLKRQQLMFNCRIIIEALVYSKTL